MGNVNLLVYDAATKTYKNKRDYQSFVKKIKGFGYCKLQNSFYYKTFDNSEKAKMSIIKIEQIVPKSIIISIITISEQKYNEIFSINYSLPKIDTSTIICI